AHAVEREPFAFGVGGRSGRLPGRGIARAGRGRPDVEVDIDDGAFVGLGGPGTGGGQQEGEDGRSHRRNSGGPPPAERATPATPDRRAGIQPVEPPLRRLARGCASSYTRARCWKSRWV